MPLTNQEIEYFKNKLLNMRAKLVNILKETRQEMKNATHTSYANPESDDSADVMDDNTTVKISSDSFKIVQRIDRALEKIEEGSYGICDITKKEIPKKRLEVIPYANITVDAQANLEKSNEL